MPTATCEERERAGESCGMRCEVRPKDGRGEMSMENSCKTVRPTEHLTRLADSQSVPGTSHCSSKPALGGKQLKRVASYQVRALRASAPW